MTEKQREKFALEAIRIIRKVVDEQAEDAGLWFSPIIITEDYLQRALRKLHEVIENNTNDLIGGKR